MQIYQANKPEKIISFIYSFNIVKKYSTTSLADFLLESERNVLYYIAVLEDFGICTKNQKIIEVTPLGESVMKMSYDDIRRWTIKKMKDLEYIDRLLAIKDLNKEKIYSLFCEYKEIVDNNSENTIMRRSSSTLKWIEYITKYS